MFATIRSLTVLVALHAGVGFCDPPKSDPVRQPNSDLKNLQGVWTATDFRIGGVPADYGGKELIYVFRDGKVKIYLDRRELAIFYVSLTSYNKPPTIDFTGDGDDVVRMLGAGKGIYALDGDKLTLSFNPISKRRPKEFNWGSRAWTMTLERSE
ncbi:MAG TPA: TIGR03067 domain-containing protein [Pirellulales bacterium]|nr:TIGR03067 domain-containing protein [Pirellulales bacterium]